MALEGVSSTSTAFQDSTRSTQKAVNNSRLIQNTNSSNTEPIEKEEKNKLSNESVVVTLSDEQEDNKDENTDAKRIMNAVKQSNQKLKDAGMGWEFNYQRETERVSIKLVDRETNEVIREIPSEETIKILEKLWNMTGILLDERR